MKASTTHTLKTDEVNSRSGRIGAVARRSTSAKTTRDTSDPMTIQTIVGEVQGYCVPPHESASVSPAAPRETKTMPR